MHVVVRVLWRKRWARATVYALLVAGAVGAVVAAGAPRGPHDDGPLPILTGPHAVSHVDPRLTRVATALAGRRLQVRCWSAPDWRRRAAEVKSFTPAHVDVHSPWSGYRSRDHERANLGPDVCRRLARLAYGHAGPTNYDDAWWLAWSLALFAHVVGPSEKQPASECHAMQRIDTTGGAFGLSRIASSRLARLFWTDVYPREGPKDRSDECRPGGKLDL